MGELRYHFPVAFSAKSLSSRLLGAFELITMASESHSTHLKYMNICKSFNPAWCLNTGLYLEKKLLSFNPQVLLKTVHLKSQILYHMTKCGRNWEERNQCGWIHWKKLLWIGKRWVHPWKGARWMTGRERPCEKVAGMGAVMNTIRKRGTSRIWDAC